MRENEREDDESGERDEVDKGRNETARERERRENERRRTKERGMREDYTQASIGGVARRSTYLPPGPHDISRGCKESRRPLKYFH